MWVNETVKPQPLHHPLVFIVDVEHSTVVYAAMVTLPRIHTPPRARRFCGSNASVTHQLPLVSSGPDHASWCFTTHNSDATQCCDHSASLCNATPFLHLCQPPNLFARDATTHYFVHEHTEHRHNGTEGTSPYSTSLPVKPSQHSLKDGLD